MSDWTEVATFPSSSSNKVYTVKKNAAGEFGCDCPAYRFQKGAVGERTCKHIQMIERGGVSVKKPWRPPPAPVEFTPQIEFGCALLNPLAEAESKGFLLSPDYAMQEKMDGKRMLIGRRGPSNVYALNRSGKECAFPTGVALRLAKQKRGDFLLDGETIGPSYFVFDVLLWQGRDVRDRPLSARLDLLTNLTESDDVRVIPTALTLVAKHDLLNTLHARGAEGFVLKHLTGRYVAGRPGSGQGPYKVKFWNTASFIVVGHNEKGRHSVDVSLRDGKKLVPVGSVTAKGQGLPPLGSVIEVKYLYAFRGGKIYQPEMLYVRDDIGHSACTMDQLKYKNEGKG